MTTVEITVDNTQLSKEFVEKTDFSIDWELIFIKGA